MNYELKILNSNLTLQLELNLIYDYRVSDLLSTFFKSLFLKDQGR